MSPTPGNSLSFSTDGFDTELLLSLYQQLLLPRMIEEKMLLLRRQGRISKWFSGYGQEAISVAATAALNSDEYILPRIRNLGVFTTRKVALDKLFAQFEAKAAGFTSGRDRTFHFNSLEHHIIAAPSLLGPQLEIALGLALAIKKSNSSKVVLAFTGDGESSQGAFHEALNVASVWKLPIIFLMENNGYALSTPGNQQYACETLSQRAAGYGMDGVTINGNNVLEVYSTITEFANRLRSNPCPVFIECQTFRIRGHEEGSGIDYVPEALIQHWEALDPVVNFENFLIENNLLNESKIAELKNSYNSQIETSREFALQQPEIKADNSRETQAVYANSPIETISPRSNESTDLRMIDAINQSLDQSMERNPDLTIMGQDIAEHGGVFKATKGLYDKYGSHRVINTPLCESAILGAAAGLAITGSKAIVELQFADFAVCGMNQLVNIYSKWNYRSEQQLPIVVRMPSGAGVGAGPLHSASYEAWFAHMPGLKLVYPSNPVDAKGLLASAIEDPNPVLFFEHKALYRAEAVAVPKDFYTLPLGKASVVNQGTQATIVTYGIGVSWAKDFISKHPEYSLEIVDLKTLIPLDFETIANSIKKTSRALILYEAPLTGGFGAELAARIADQCFSFLDAPVIRCANLDTPVPQAEALEHNYLAKSRLKESVERLLQY